MNKTIQICTAVALLLMTTSAGLVSVGVEPPTSVELALEEQIGAAGVALLGGQHEEALKLAGRAADDAQRVGWPTYLAVAKMVRSFAYDGLGCGEVAAREMDASLAIFASSGDHYSAWLVGWAAGELGLKAGKLERARELLEGSLVQLENLKREPSTFSFDGVLLIS